MSKFLKIQTKSSLLGPNQKNGFQAQQTQICLLIDPCEQKRLWPYSFYIQADLSLGCLFMHLPILARFPWSLDTYVTVKTLIRL